MWCCGISFAVCLFVFCCFLGLCLIALLLVCLLYLRCCLWLLVMMVIDCGVAFSSWLGLVVSVVGRLLVVW